MESSSAFRYVFSFFLNILVWISITIQPSLTRHLQMIFIRDISSLLVCARTSNLHSFFDVIKVLLYSQTPGKYHDLGTHLKSNVTLIKGQLCIMKCCTLTRSDLTPSASSTIRGALRNNPLLTPLGWSFLASVVGENQTSHSVVYKSFPNSI